MTSKAKIRKIAKKAAKRAVKKAFEKIAKNSKKSKTKVDRFDIPLNSPTST
jgi:hypothetical protein